MNKFMLCACGALLAGVTATAAEVSVTGNNTAVVIQKDVVQSKNKYQFLCVPVKGFDISGNKSVGVSKLSELLPPTTMKSATQITLDIDGASVTYFIQSGSDGTPYWSDDDGNSVNDYVMTAGKIFWLNDGPSAATVFCGEENSGFTDTKGDGMIQIGNQSSEKIKILEYFTKANVPGLIPGKSILYRVQNGSNAYKMYFYRGDGVWKAREGNSMFAKPITAEEAILPGEAFYLQNPKPKTL